MGKTKIEWTKGEDGEAGMTWNPVRGCSRVSEGCRHCYAERLAARGLPGLNSPTTGEPFAKTFHTQPRWTGKVELIESTLELPLRWRKPSKIFVNSMSDLFHASLSDEAIDRVFAVMALCPQHTFQVLTKRPERMRGATTRHDVRGRVHVAISKVTGTAWGNQAPQWPLPNVWLGVSCENQATADERIPLLLQTPAAVRFISAEPLLGPVDLCAVSPRGGSDGFGQVLRVRTNALNGRYVLQDIWGGWNECGEPGARLDWVIVGGESGPGARPMHPDWAQSLRDQCVDAGVPFFFKQWGEWLPDGHDGNPKNADGQVLNCSQAPIRVGKHAAGRLLDGREWDELPEVSR